ncbi:aminopeptidase [Halorubellus sp. PRR65]|uniref:aminopeptidase n=1 Tax=Halorubellus sp. PRR65 TaxID=3098148 RepID=UPI002B259835|nr:aminopeptidase [Halorubellus sp. PRR65]
MSDLSVPARTAIEQCMDVREDESVVVVTDDERRPIGEALYEAALAATDDATVLQYPPGENHGEEPPEAVAAAMAAADVFLAPTSKSLSHTRARSAATDAGARGATLPGITEDVFTTGLDADYERIAAGCEDVLAQVADAEEVRVTTDLGTDITFEAGDRDWRADTGMVHEDGDFSNLPAGEVFVAPETANGRFVVDGTMMPYERLDDDQTLAFDVADGQVTDIEDDRIAEQFAELAADAGDVVYNLAELGIGTNVAVTDLVGSVLLDEKAAGTVHIAIGDNAGIGGDTDAPIHSDGVIRDPTVYADGEEVDLPTPERS